MKGWRRGLLLVLMLWLAGPVHAQQAYWKQFGAADGLRQPFVYALAQDRSGYLWLATAEGALRYDGSAFQLFTTREGLAEDFATGLRLEPGTGALWVQHFQGGVSRWNGQQFRAEPRPSRPTTGLLAPDTAALAALRRRFRLQLPPGLVPTSVLTDREGTVWVGTAGQGLWRLIAPALSRLPPQALPPSWAGPAPVLSTAQRARLPARAQVTSLARTATGQLWVGTALHGAFCFEPGSLRPVQYSTANGLLHNTVVDVLADRRGRLWFASHGTGLAMRENGRFRYFRLVKSGVDATALAEDAAGRVWVGTEGDGLWYFIDGAFRQFTENEGLASNYCYGLASFPNGDLLVVHHEALSRVNSRQPAIQVLTTPASPLVRECLPRAAAVDTAGIAWVGTRNGTLRLLPGAAPVQRWPLLALRQVSVDGARRSVEQLSHLPAGRYRLAFAWQGLSLAQAGLLQYQYRLRGYQEAWSRPAALGEAEFPRLEAGQYEFEGRARLGPAGAWTQPVRMRVGIALPWWRRPWVLAATVLALLVGLAGLVRVREQGLRRRQRQLEAMVQARTAELQAEKAHIEHLNAELTVARDQAESSRVAKSRFLANMSHEIRTPMNAVIGLTYLLQRMPTTAEQREYLNAIEGSSQNLLTIINDILDSSKIEAGKLTLEQAPFGLRALLARVGRMFAFAADSKGLTLVLDLDPEVPIAIVGDSVRLQQILVNLLGNAIKFTTQGSVTLRVDAEPAAEPEQWRLRIAVSDTGIGIAADKLEAIFEDFAQANTTTTRQFGGTGLGLSIARSLVELNGGQLRVESELGHGATFWFELPCTAADPALVPAEGPAQLRPFASTLRVLVAEDNDLNQLVARKTLEAWNVKVIVAPNGRQAVEAATRQAFDAVLMDVQMPEMDGYEATRQLRLLFPDPAQLPIIGLTASALPEDRALALAAGMNDTLPKPFDPATLYAVLAHCTGQSAGSLPESDNQADVPQELPAAELLPDWSLLEELSFGDKSFVQQVVATFLQQAPQLLAQLQTAAAQGEADSLGPLAHKLRGQVAYFGLPAVLAVLSRLEHPRPDDAPPAEVVAVLSSQLAALYPALHARQLTAP